MSLNDTVKGAILKLETLCESCKKSPLSGLGELEETVSHLSHKVQSLDLASDQSLKKELNTLEKALLNLSSVLQKQQEDLTKQVHEIDLHQRALHAYSRVANNNLGSLV